MAREDKELVYWFQKPEIIELCKEIWSDKLELLLRKDIVYKIKELEKVTNPVNIKW